MNERLALAVLEDIDWVVGSFVGNRDGELLMSSMPADFSAGQLERTASRIASIVRCAELSELDVERCELSLNRYKLVVRRFDGGLLCVMVEAPVNRRALSMAMRLTLRDLPRLVQCLQQGGSDERA